MSAPDSMRSRAGASRSRRVSEHVAADIVRYIQERALEPGSRIGTEEELAREFGVSRPTLREALRMLSSGDLVRATKGPGGGIFVANTVEKGLGRSISDFIAMMLETRRVTIDELLEARMLVEVPLAGLAAYRADAEALAEIRSAVEESRANLHDRAELRRADIRIHAAIAAAGGNRVVEAFMQWTLDVLQPSLTAIIEHAVVESAIVDQHEALLRALERGDPVRAERAMREHVEYVRDLLRVVEDGHESLEQRSPPRGNSP
jgi:GntR family transcriptional repressor for pyruvate dehydrogenase complex